MPDQARRPGPESDRTQIGLHFAKTPVDKQVRWLFLIPAGAPQHEVRASYTIPPGRNLHAVGISPHMHLLTFAKPVPLPGGTRVEPRSRLQQLHRQSPQPECSSPRGALGRGDDRRDVYRIRAGHGGCGEARVPPVALTRSRKNSLSTRRSKPPEPGGPRVHRNARRRPPAAPSPSDAKPFLPQTRGAEPRTKVQ